jgi:hypothetical protein
MKQVLALGFANPLKKYIIAKGVDEGPIGVEQQTVVDSPVEAHQRV